MEAVTIAQPVGARRCNALDGVVQMAEKEIYAIMNIDEVTFRKFFQSRIVRTQISSAPRYALKVATKILMMPLYYCAFKLYQYGSRYPEDK
jgi:hypothetical protein